MNKKHSSGALTAIIFLTGLLPSAGEAQANPAADAARAWRQDHEQQILDEYLELLRIPNVSRDLPNVRRNAERLSAITLCSARAVAVSAASRIARARAAIVRVSV